MYIKHNIFMKPIKSKLQDIEILSEIIFNKSL